MKKYYFFKPCVKRSVKANYGCELKIPMLMEPTSVLTKIILREKDSAAGSSSTFDYVLP